MAKKCVSVPAFAFFNENEAFLKVQNCFQLKELKQSLSNLRLGETLVLHGMVLSGKSSLVAAALRDRKLLKNAFNNKVIWIDLGEIHNVSEDKDKIIFELYK